MSLARGELRSIVIAVIAALSVAGRADAVDGIAVTTHYELDKPKSIHFPQYSSLVRHDVRDGVVVGSRTIYDRGDAGMCVLSPTGDSLAFLRNDGAVMVMTVDGGEARQVAELKHFGDTALSRQAICPIYWPIGRDDEWLYVRDHPAELHRVSLDTGRRELVIKFNRTIEMAMSRYADKRQGLIVGRPAEAMLVIYDLAAGTGDLYNDVATFGEQGACGQAISPDGSLIAANNGGHNRCRLIDPDGNKIGEFALNQWAPEGDRPERMWQFFRWSNHPVWLMVTQGGGGSGQDMAFTNAMLLNWKEGRQVRLTNNAAGSFDYSGGFHETNVEMLLQLGLQSGEAPYTATLALREDARGWRWDYGDGATGAEPQHTYVEAGSYTVTARKGDAIRRGKVAVRPQRPTRAIAAMVDANHVIVRFDEPVVVAEGTRWSTESGLTSEEIRLSDDARNALARLSGNLTDDDSLTLSGVTDRAQVPNAPAEAKLRVAYRHWPATLDGATFVWQTDAAINALWDADGEHFVEAFVLPEGLARRDRYGAMITLGGSFQPLKPGWDPDHRLMVQGRRDKELTIELVFAPDRIEQAQYRRQPNEEPMPAMLYSWAWGNKSGFFVAQDGDRLYFQPQTMISWGKGFQEPVTIGTITDLSLQHVLITQREGELAIYRNGERVVHRTDIGGQPWFHGARTRFGNYGWRGRIDMVAVRTKFTEDATARASYEAAREALARRPTVEQIEVEAKLIVASRLPEPKQILPYHNALVVNEWQLLHVVRGRYEDDKVRVAHWAILGDEKLETATVQPGQQRTLKLERWSDNPMLEREFLSDTLEEDFDMPLFVEAD
ncbi:MAG: hypothetical protein HQ592_17165 [Planctomycetes bacterium]|nr:hypothetical protein [Planctomycetota bacterium]